MIFDKIKPLLFCTIFFTLSVTTMAMDEKKITDIFSDFLSDQEKINSILNNQIVLLPKEFYNSIYSASQQEKINMVKQIEMRFTNK